MRDFPKMMFGLVLCYLASYVAFRINHVDVTPGKPPTVIFAVESTWIYYFFRPLTFVDGLLTGMQFHIGPHQS